MIESAPAWFLTIAYWLHMLATVTWLGGLAALTLIALPVAKKTLPEAEFSRFLYSGIKRLSLIGWLSLAILVVTGMFQMSSHPSYQGFLTIQNVWAGAIFAKHLVIGLMVLLAGYSTWVIQPRYARLHLQRHVKKIEGNLTDLKKLEHQEQWILRGNLLVAAIVLLLTAVARSA